MIDTAFHKFGHKFLESVLQRHKKLHKKHSHICKLLEEENREKMSKMGYRDWDRVFIENLIRAVQAKPWEHASGEKLTQWILNESPKRGFQLIPILHDIIEEYEQSRDKHKDFEVFFPDLFAKLDERMKNM